MSASCRWIPGDMEFLRASNLSQKFEPDVGTFDEYGHELPCPASDREAVIISDDVAMLDDGRMIVFDQGNRMSHESLTFSSSEYCIDRVSLLENFTVANGRSNQNGKVKRALGIANATVAARAFSYVVLVCRPCSRITCVPKCCANGFVLESQKIIGCRKATSVANASAAIRLKSANGTELKSTYIYMNIKRVDGSVFSKLMIRTIYRLSFEYISVFKVKIMVVLIRT